MGLPFRLTHRVWSHTSTITVILCKSWSGSSDIKETFTVHDCFLSSEEQFDKDCMVKDENSVELVYKS